MTLYRAEGIQTVPAKKRDVADVTGAGDTVIATLAVMLGGGRRPVRSGPRREPRRRHRRW